MPKKGWFHFLAGVLSEGMCRRHLAASLDSCILPAPVGWSGPLLIPKVHIPRPTHRRGQSASPHVRLESRCAGSGSKRSVSKHKETKPLLSLIRILITILVTTSKALVTTSEALVITSKGIYHVVCLVSTIHCLVMDGLFAQNEQRPSRTIM